MLCPCDSNKSYLACCGPLHSGEQFASSAKQLMVSRFTAYCMGKYQYVYQTYGKQQRQDLSVALLSESDVDCHWIRLKVLQTSQQENTGTVEFVAIYAIDNQLYQLRETSRFEMQNERWVYTTGELHHENGSINKKRNDPCPCHSGKKFKKCCSLRLQQIMSR